jgi:membrane-bound inhibitor of C-type lysozyme
VLSASGIKYMNDQLTFWTKGQKAFLIWDKQNLECEQQE